VKVYTYPLLDDPRAKDFHLFESGYFQPSDPDDADWFYCPVDLGRIWWESKAQHGDPKGGKYVRNYVESLPYYKGNRRMRHFFHDYSACYDDWGLKSVLFRAVKSKHDPNPLTISIPHFVDDLQPGRDDFSQLPYDVCFVGRVNASVVREAACLVVARDKSIKSFMRLHQEFFGHIPEGTPQWEERRAEFINGFRMSKLALSPRGVELDAYRTWEAMSAGRVAIWVGDTYELPFEDFLDYSKFMFIFHECDAAIMNKCIKQILANYTDAQLQVMGEEARRMWLEWFRIEAVPKVFAHYLGGFCD